MSFTHIYYSIIIIFWLVGMFGILHAWLTAGDQQQLAERIAARKTR